jgi:hypothetical protein
MNSGVRRALWKERVRQWRDSGLSQRAFALEHGWPVRQAGYWIRKLRDDVGAKAPELVPVVIRSGNVAEAAAGAGRRAMRRHRLRVQQPAPQPAQTRVRQWRSMSSGRTAAGPRPPAAPGQATPWPGLRRRPAGPEKASRGQSSALGRSRRYRGSGQ